MPIKEFSEVETTRDIDRYGLAVGTVGTVVDIHGGGEAFEVEFDQLADTCVTATLTADEIRTVSLIPAG